MIKFLWIWSLTETSLSHTLALLSACTFVVTELRHRKTNILFPFLFYSGFPKYALKTVVKSLVAAGNWIEMLLKPQLHIIYCAFQ